TTPAQISSMDTNGRALELIGWSGFYTGSEATTLCRAIPLGRCTFLEVPRGIAYRPANSLSCKPRERCETALHLKRNSSKSVEKARFVLRKFLECICLRSFILERTLVSSAHLASIGAK